MSDTLSGHSPSCQHGLSSARSEHALALEASVLESLVDDVTQICQRVPFVERYPSRLWSVGLVSELAEASDRLAVAVSKLQEATGADR